MIKRFSIGKCLLILLGFCSANNIKAQDPHFAQFYANSTYLNPAFAGSQGCPRICINYRNQWPNISGTFVTTSCSFDTRIDGISGGLGFHFLNDQAGQGTLRSTRFSAMYAYQTNISREFSMAFGLQATYGQKKMDWSKLTFGDMIDQKYGFSSSTQEQQPDKQVVSYPDFSAGVLGYSRIFYAGFAVAHLTQPNESLISGSSPLYRKYNGHAGAVIPLDGKYGQTTISPNIIYQQQRNFRELNIGLYLTKGSFVGGLWYRTSDAVVLLIGFQQNAIRLGYSYDITVSKLKTATAGSHEISLQLLFKCKPRHKRFRTVNCPAF